MIARLREDSIVRLVVLLWLGTTALYIYSGVPPDVLERDGCQLISAARSHAGAIRARVISAAAATTLSVMAVTRGEIDHVQHRVQPLRQCLARGHRIWNLPGDDNT